MPRETPDGLRIDRWLWFARFYKSRSLATAAVRGGHVRLNGERARPGARVQIGDSVRISKDQLEFELEVLELPLRRGPPAKARAAWREDESSESRRQAEIERRRVDRMQMPRTDGRPDKRTRRLLRDRSRR